MNSKQDELVTIVNDKTKQVKQVRRSELPDYGLPVDYVSQADTYANGLIGGQFGVDKIPEAYRAGALSSVGYQGKEVQTPEDF